MYYKHKEKNKATVDFFKDRQLSNKQTLKQIKEQREKNVSKQTKTHNYCKIF